MNIGLLICVGFLVLQIKDVWNDEYKIKAPDNSTRREPQKATVRARNRPHHPREYYEPVVNKNLFRPERTEWITPTKDPEPTVSTTSDPEVVVYGIVICDDLKQAWVRVKQQAPKSKRRRPNKTSLKGKVKKITEGDTLEGWEVKDIEPDAIYLSQGENTLEYSLIEPGKPKQRVVPATSYKNAKRKKHLSRSKAKRRAAKKRALPRRRLPTKRATRKR
jgi:hypothetical protein